MKSSSIFHANGKPKRLRRIGSRCMCAKCLASVGPLTKRIGKMWQARYGESQRDFRNRFNAWHRGEQ